MSFKEHFNSIQCDPIASDYFICHQTIAAELRQRFRRRNPLILIIRMSGICDGKKRSNEFRFRQDSVGFPQHRKLKKRSFPRIFGEIVVSFDVLAVPSTVDHLKVGQFEMFDDGWQLMKFLDHQCNDRDDLS